MMPGAVHSAVDHQTFRQRSAVMGALCADGKEFFATPGDKNWFPERVSREHRSIGEVIDTATLFKIRSLWFARRFSHKKSLQPVIKESHRSDPTTVLQSLYLPNRRLDPFKREKY